VDYLHLVQNYVKEHLLNNLDKKRLLSGDVKFNKKVEELVDSLFMTFVRQSLSASDVEEILEYRDRGLLFDFNEFSNLIESQLSLNNITLVDFWHPKWRSVGESLLLKRTLGLGTPNAAAGAGELFFLFSSKEFRKPTKGDVACTIGGNDVIIELKGHGGKIGTSPGNLVNDCVVNVIQENNIECEILRNTGRYNHGKISFVPNTQRCRDFIDSISIEDTKKVFETWWNAQSVSPFPLRNDRTRITWDRMKEHFIRLCAEKEFGRVEEGKTKNILLLVEKNRIFRNATDVIETYKSMPEIPDRDFEFRAFQKNDLALYLH